MSSDALIGKRLGDYTIQSLLGQGGMARVYKGYDSTLQRYAAVKVVEPRLLAAQDEKEYRERFLREARSIARINHPNVVSVYQFGELDNLYYMAMSFIEGDDLRDIIKEYHRQKTYIPTNQVIKIIRDIAEALDYVHKNDVIHRDVKPSNIMVTADGRAVLTDFGLALTAQEGTLGNTFGSVHYIAPEQAISSAQAVPQSDLYSLGIVLYEMLTGRVPFEDASAMSVALKHISDPPPMPSMFNPRITPHVEEVLMKILDKDPRKRYPSGRAFADALQAAFMADIEMDTEVLGRDRTSSDADLASRLRKPDVIKNSATANKPPSLTRSSSLLRPQKLDAVADDSPTAKDLPPTALMKEKDRSTTSKKLEPIPIPKPSRKRNRIVLGGFVVMMVSVFIALAIILNNRPEAPALIEDDGILPTRIALNPDSTEELGGAGGVNGGVQNTPQRRNDADSTATPTDDKTSQLLFTPTPHIDALNPDEPDLLLYYDDRMFVLYNRSVDEEITLDVSGLTFIRPSDTMQFESNEWLRVTPRSIRLSQMRKVDCFQIIDQPFTALSLPDFCTFNQGYIRTPRSFWLSDNPDVFEVRRGDTVLATCTTISTTSESATRCLVDLDGGS
jgi:serine/threonine protein kinase